MPPCHAAHNATNPALTSACSWGRAAANPTRPLLTDAPNSDITAANTPTSGNVLDNASLPPGTTATITGFTVTGSSTVHAPGTPVALTDPTKGTPVGTLVLKPDGTYTFTPAPDFVGPVPAIQTYVRSSDGQSVISSLTITVLPSKIACTHTHTETWLVHMLMLLAACAAA